MKHYIICKFVEGFDLENNLPKIKEIFDQTKEIKGIYEVEYIKNIINRPNRADLMIVITLDEEALPVYDASNPHKTWKEQFGKYVKEKTIFDATK